MVDNPSGPVLWWLCGHLAAETKGTKMKFIQSIKAAIRERLLALQLVVVSKAAQKVADRLDLSTAEVADEIAERYGIDARTVASEISAGSIAEEFCISSIADHFSDSDIASEIDLGDLIDHIDLDDIRDDLARAIDIDKLGAAVLKRLVANVESLKN